MLYIKVHVDVSTGLEPKKLSPQNPGAGRLGQSWDKNTGLLKHSPMVYTQNTSFVVIVRPGTVSPFFFEGKPLQIRISHSEKG